MMSQKGNLLLKCFIFHCLLVFCILGFCTTAHAWSSKRATTSEQTLKPLNRSQQHMMAQKVINNLLKNKFFQKQDLAQKIVITLLDVKGSETGMTARQYTDLVLNTILKTPMIMVPNVEITMDMGMDFKLMHYVDRFETRKKGILLGASYYLYGDIYSQLIEVSEKKVAQSYKTTLYVRDIHTDELMAQAEYVYTRKTYSKSKIRKDR